MYIYVYIILTLSVYKYECISVNKTVPTHHYNFITHTQIIIDLVKSFEGQSFVVRVPVPTHGQNVLERGWTVLKRWGPGNLMKPLAMLGLNLIVFEQKAAYFLLFRDFSVQPLCTGNLRRGPDLGGCQLRQKSLRWSSLAQNWSIHPGLTCDYRPNCGENRTRPGCRWLLSCTWLRKSKWRCTTQIDRNRHIIWNDVQFFLCNSMSFAAASPSWAAELVH